MTIRLGQYETVESLTQFKRRFEVSEQELIEATDTADEILLQTNRLVDDREVTDPLDAPEDIIQEVVSRENPIQSVLEHRDTEFVHLYESPVHRIVELHPEQTSTREQVQRGIDNLAKGLERLVGRDIISETEAERLQDNVRQVLEGVEHALGEPLEPEHRLSAESLPDGGFAYGKNRVAGCGCPAVRAGYDGNLLDLPMGAVVEIYDQILVEKQDDEEGIVDEDTAKEAWNEAIRRTAREDATRQARAVADELGWSD